jgi:hypothetical protein
MTENGWYVIYALGGELREKDQTTPFDEPMIPEVTKLSHPRA